MLVATLLFWFVLSSHYCSAVIRPGNSTTVLPVGALSSRGQIADFSDQIPALELAVDIINDDDTILKDYHLDLQVLTSQCTGLDATIDFFNLTRDSRKNSSYNPFMFIIGAGCSPRSEGVNLLMPFMNMLMVEYVASSAALSNRTLFPNFFRIEYVETANHLAQAYFIRHLNYANQRVGIILQDEGLFTERWKEVERVYVTAGIRITVVRFSDQTLDEQVETLFTDPPAMFVLNAFEEPARRIFCKAVARGLVYPKYGWIFPGWFGEEWWKSRLYEESCVNSVIDRFIGNTVVVSVVTRQDDANKTTDVKLTPAQFSSKFKEYFSNSSYVNNDAINPMRYITYNRYAYDAVWAMAKALNQSLNPLQERKLKLEDFDYFEQGSIILTILKEQLQQINFTGISGRIAFQNGTGERIRIPAILSVHRRSSSGQIYVSDIASVEDGNVLLVEELSTIFPAGIPRLQLTTAHPVVYGFLVAVAAISTILSLFFIFFTLFNRRKKRIRASSPLFNIIVAVGSIVFYVAVPIMFAPYDAPEQHDLRCQLNIWCPSVGYFLISFPLMLKTARVYYIFHYPSVQAKAIKDWKLLLVFLLGLAFVSLLSIISTTIPGVKSVPKEAFVFNELRVFCEGGFNLPIVIVIFVFHAIVFFIGIALSFQTRNTHIKAFKESRQIAAVFLLLTLSGVLIWSLYLFVTVSIIGITAFVGFGLTLSTLISICILFIPKIYYLWVKKDDDIGSTWTQEEDLTSLHRTTIFSLQQEIDELQVRVKDFKTKMAGKCTCQESQKPLNQGQNERSSELVSRSRAVTYSPMNATTDTCLEYHEMTNLKPS